MGYLWLRAQTPRAIKVQIDISSFVPLTFLCHANLLVVFLLVGHYKTERAEARDILQSAWEEDSWTAKEERLFAGGHDFVRFFSATLTASGSRATHHRHDAAPYLRSFQGIDRAVSAGTG